MAASGGLTVMLYEERFLHNVWALFTDAATGAKTHVAIPIDSTSGWGGAAYALTPGQLWVFSGGGPMYLRRYALSGSPLPTAATRIEVRTFGDGDSRPGDMIATAGGGIVAVWHQQGETGSQGHRVAYRDPVGSWTTRSMQFIPTMASKDVLVQHPADGSVWLFSNPDAFGAIGAARFAEVAGAGLSLSWTDATFIDPADGLNNADPENPNLVAAPDPAGGRIALVYQSAERKTFSYSPFVTGSYPVIARIGADGSKSFVKLRVWVERVSPLGVIVEPGGTWLAHRPIDAADLSFDDVNVARYRDGAWTSVRLGTLWQPYEPIHYGTSKTVVAARLSDGKIHTYAF